MSAEAALILLVLAFSVIRAVFQGLRGLVRFGKKFQTRETSRPPEQAPAPAEAAPRRLEPRQNARAAAPPATPTPGASPAPSQNAPPDGLTLRADGQELLRALVWQEILAPPLSRRRRQPPSH